MQRLIIGAWMLCTLLSIGLAVPQLPEGWRYPAALVTASAVQTEPVVASRGDSVFVAWIDNRATPAKVYFRRSTNKGFTWSTAQVVVANYDTAWQYLSIAADQNSPMIYLAWTCRWVNVSDIKYGLKVARSTNRGQNWTYQALESNLLKDPCASVCVDGRTPYGYVYIGYDRSSSTATNRESLYCAVSSNQGSDYTRERVFLLPNDASYDMKHTATTTIPYGGNYPPQIAFTHGYYDIVYHAHKTTGGWETTSTPGDACAYRYGIDLEGDVNNNLHLFIIGSTTLNYRKGTYSGGWTWSDPVTLIVGSGSGHPSAVVYGNNLEVVYYQNSGGAYVLYHSKSLNLGESWVAWNGNLYERIWYYDQQSLSNDFPRIAVGANERHVVFRTKGLADIWYMANDDLQLSDTALALAYNWGRHLLRDPFSGRLDMVYYSQRQPRYTYSEDNGATWAPYYIFEEYSAAAPKDSGFYPTVGHRPTMGLTMLPCAVYVDDANQVRYRYRKDDGTWAGFMVRDATNGINDPPSMATTAGNDSVHVLIPVRWSSPKRSAIKCYSFKSSATSPGTETEIDYYDGSTTRIAEPCITYDGDYNLHCVWKNNNEIVYRTRNPSGTWDPPLSQAATLVSTQSSAYPDFTPFVEVHGTDLGCVWCSERTSGQRNSREIYRRLKDLSVGGTWGTPMNYSGSSGLPSEYPVNAGVDFSVWPESAVAGNRFDIRYKSDAYGSGWVAASQPHEYFCHSQIQRDATPWSLYTVFTRGNSAPYYLVADARSFGLLSGSTFYAVETGESVASPFCLQRDGPVRYSAYKVDHGANEISYNLHFLDPVYPAHVLRGTLYFEGTGQKTHQLLINNVERLSAKVNPGQAYTFEVSIPRELYQDDHRVILTLRSPTGDGVYLAGLEITRSIEGKALGGGSGVQSAETDNLGQMTYLRIQPNPARTKAVISYSMPGASRLSLKVFDATGRLVRQFDRLTDCQGSITWDGCDRTGSRVAKGIYFIELVSDKEVRTEKLVITR